MVTAHGEHANSLVITPQFIDSFIEIRSNGQEILTDIKGVLAYIEKRTESNGLISTYYSGPMMWYSAAMDLRGGDPIAKLSLGIQRGDGIEEHMMPYRQTENDLWRSIEKAAYPLPREFSPQLSIEYAVFEALKRKRATLSEPRSGMHPKRPEKQLLRA